MNTLRIEWAAPTTAPTLPTAGNLVSFHSRGAAGVGAGTVTGEIERIDGERTAVRVHTAPPGARYAVGSVYWVESERLTKPVPVAARIPDPKPAPETARPAPQSAPRKNAGPLTETYRPARLCDVRGQDDAVGTMTEYVRAPYPASFLMSGPTGTGKTSSARALAAELGVSVDDGPFGGFLEIASGEQTGESVRDAVRQCHTRPMRGSGWKVLLVNEADYITPQAAMIWLDVLESLPPLCVVIFTTNDVKKLPARLRDRFTFAIEFEGDSRTLRPAAESLARDVWKDSTGRDDCPRLEDLGRLTDEDGKFSFRRLLQRMEPFARSGRHPADERAVAA